MIDAAKLAEVLLGTVDGISDCGGRRRARRKTPSMRRAMAMARPEPRLAAMAIVLDAGIIRWCAGCADASVGMTKIVVEIVVACALETAVGTEWLKDI